MSARKARVEFNRRGDQDIEQSDQDSGVSCETPEQAERVAQICAAYQQPCELGASCGAYQRVLIDANADQATKTLQLVTLAADSEIDLSVCGRASFLRTDPLAIGWTRA